jgi:tRNA U34 2-thiouridine synthase MnmA/TrmU
MKKPKALVLFSGGLDSILTTKILIEQGVKPNLITFQSYFFSSKQSEKSARQLSLKIKVIDISKEHLKIVKSPQHGYGSSVNPCIDCHLLMLKKAKEIMKKEKFDFVATGEVLGERPMSQNRKALDLIEKESSLKGYLLRPLSAQLLEETIPEKKGWVIRSKLFAISGRSREKQLKLAQKWKIDWYPSPAGGCLLTDLEFGRKLKELLQKYPQFNGNNVQLLKYGRHFWKGKVKIIVGRNHEENLIIGKLARKKDILIEMENYMGPSTLVRSHYLKKTIPQKTLKKAQSLTQYYSTKSRNKKDVIFKIKNK